MTMSELQQEAKDVCVLNEYDPDSEKGISFVSGYMACACKREDEKILNAQIKSTRLGTCDGPAFTLFLTLDIQDGGGVSVGGIALDEYNKIKKERVGSAYGMNVIMRVLEVVGVTKWEELTGKFIRIECGGIGSTVTKFGNLMKDEWMDFTEFGKEYL